MGFEDVELSRELRNTSGSGIPMERSFGHGFVKGGGGFLEKGVSRLCIVLLESSFKFFHGRIGSMQDRVFPHMTFLGLTGTFDS